MNNQLTEKEINALKELQACFNDSIIHIDDILENKSCPKDADFEIGYVVRDWTTRDCGFQNESITALLKTVADLKDRLDDVQEESS